MAKVNFYLKEPSSKEETLIYMFFHYNGARLKYSTGETILPKFWNDEDQRVKKSLTGHSEINGLLDRIEECIKKIYREGITFGNVLSNVYLKEKLDKELDLTVKGSLTFIDYLDEFIAVQKPFKTLGTIQKYNALKSHLTLFQSKKNFNISFEKIDTRFYELFTTFCMTDLILVNNTIAKYIKSLKTFLRWATDRGYNKSLAFIKFKAKERDADIIYLTEEELFEIYNLDLSNNIALDKVRDTFCFGCFTGLRHSDIIRVTKENVKKDEINFISEKTTENLSIPLNEFSEAILKKYNYSLPVISNQKTNEHLKDIGKMAKIKEPVMITRFRGAEEIQVTQPKYKFIGTHTARRTFVTLSLEKGMRPEIVMSITGHKQYNTFKKYIKITNKVKNVDMKRIWNRENQLLEVV